MAEYRFHLLKYKTGNKGTCPHCGRHNCFVHYVDEKGEISFPDTVGLCDHVNSCGYHYSPKDYFSDNPQLKLGSDTLQAQHSATFKAQKPDSSYIEASVMQSSFSAYFINPLHKYLTGVFGEAETNRLFSLYNVGTAKLWGGSTIFWQVDAKGRIRSGKVMAYDAMTGHRIKDGNSHVCWAHSLLKLESFHLRQCLFGEHLLSSNLNARVVLVESEKTAIIASHFIPQYVWIATGGM